MADNDDADGRMPLLADLAELRNRIIKVVVAVVVGAVAGWFLYPWISDLLREPYCNVVFTSDEACTLLQTEPLEVFSVRLKIAGYSGVALAMPVILWQVWRFVTPGLYKHEKRYAIPFIVCSLVLFVLGALLAYYTLPRAIEFLTTIGGEGFEIQLRPAPYYELVTYMMLAFGVGFEFPIVLIFLQMAGIVETSTLRSLRRYAIVAIVILVAVITPSGDPYSLAILSIPMYLFYEIAILVGMLFERRRRRAEAVGA